MNKKLRKIIGILTCTVIVFANSLTTAKAEENDVQKGINFLLENGYSYDEIIETFPKNDLAILANATKVEEEEWYCETEENGTILSRNDNSSFSVKSRLITPGSESATTPGGKLKQTVSVFGLSDTRVMISYRFNWLKIPSNKKTDCCALLFDHADLVKVQNAYYSYKMRNLYDGSESSTTTKNRPTATSNHGVGFSFTFAQDTTHAGGIKDQQSVDHAGYISCIVSPNKKSGNALTVWSEYYHQQGSLKLSPSLSISGVDVSLSSDYQMELMSPNPYLYTSF